MISLCYLSFTSYLCSHNNSSSKSVNIHPHIMVSCSLFSDRNFHYVSQGTSCQLSIYLTVNLQEKRAAKTSRKLKNSKRISLHRFLLILELVEMLFVCFDLLIYYKRTVLRAKKKCLWLTFVQIAYDRPFSEKLSSNVHHDRFTETGEKKTGN